MLNDNFQDQLSQIKKHAKYFYFQHVIPTIGGVINIFKEPKRLLDRAFPSQIGLWFAVALALVGLLVLFNPDSFWKWQFLLIIGVLLLGPLVYKLLKKLFSSLRKMLLVYPGKEYVGKKYVLESPIVEGQSNVNLDGNDWIFSGDDLPTGTNVRVVAVKDDILYVVSNDVNEQQLEAPAGKE